MWKMKKWKHGDFTIIHALKELTEKLNELVKYFYNSIADLIDFILEGR